MIYNVEWNDTIKREVRALNNEELVKIHGIANGDVLVQRGTMERKTSLSQDQAESYGWFVQLKEIMCMYR